MNDPQYVGTQNSVEYIGHYGGDDTHAMSAWTSTRRYLDEIEEGTGKPRRERIPALLRALAHRDQANWDDPKHTSPFEKSALHFLVRSDKASHIHIIKHRIGVSVNAESARYKELKEDKWLYPSDWPTIIDAEKDPVARRIRELYMQVMDNTHAAYHELVKLVTDWIHSRAMKPYTGLGAQQTAVESMSALDTATRKLARTRAKESARMVLPHASQIDQDVMFNFLSFMHFQKLRNHSKAQKEVKDLSEEMLAVVRELPGNPFAHSLKAFGY